MYMRACVVLSACRCIFGTHDRDALHRMRGMRATMNNNVTNQTENYESNTLTVQIYARSSGECVSARCEAFFCSFGSDIVGAAAARARPVWAPPHLNNCSMLHMCRSLCV